MCQETQPLAPSAPSEALATTPRKNTAAVGRVATPCRNSVALVDIQNAETQLNDADDELDDMSMDDLQILFVNMDS